MYITGPKYDLHLSARRKLRSAFACAPIYQLEDISRTISVEVLKWKVQEGHQVGEAAKRCGNVAKANLAKAKPKTLSESESENGGGQPTAQDGQ